MTVAFKDLPALNLVIDNTDLGRNYYELVKRNYKKQKPERNNRPGRYRLKF